jgi:predicted DNA-binding protein (MmcQ/YjbR family)
VQLDVLPDAELKDLIRQSYEMVAAKLPRMRRRRKPPKPGKRKMAGKKS